MSRIHDALKKAEQERIAGQPPEVVFPQADLAARQDNRSERVPGAAVADDAQAAISAPSSLLVSESYLRFDDLIANCAHPRWQLDPNVNVFSEANSGACGAEQFRTLRSRLYQLRKDQQVRTLLVTSAVPAEGKTFVASNLAQAIARQPDRRVLLIDADLRCARLHLLFGAPPTPGLTDYLRGETDEMTVIQHGQEGNLCLIAGGNEVTNPSELLSNGRLSALLNRLAPVFDWVIFDSPPCLPVADATILAELCDAVLLVVRAGVTPSETAQRALQEMQNRNVAGVVLNAVDESRDYGSYYSYGYGYPANSNGKSTSRMMRE